MIPVDVFFIIHGECSQQWPIVLLSQCVLRPPEPPSYLSVQECSYKGLFYKGFFLDALSKPRIYTSLIPYSGPSVLENGTVLFS